MQYSDFTNMVKDKILDYLPKEYASASVSLTQTTKTNGVITDALIIRKEGSNAGPVCYLNDLFLEYEKKPDFDKFMERFAKALDEQFKHQENEFKVDDYARLEYVRDKIFAEAIGLDSNRAYLEKVPYIQIADLAIIFRVGIDDDKSFVINNDIAALYGMDASMLYDVADENINKPGAVTIMGMLEKFESMGFKGYDRDGQEDMYIISNKTGVYGAGCIAFSKAMEQAIETIGEPFYILPASRHELIAIPASRTGDVDVLRGIVCEVNRSTVSESDKLSDNVYVYDVNARCINICTEPMNLSYSSELESSILR